MNASDTGSEKISLTTFNQSPNFNVWGLPNNTPVVNQSGSFAPAMQYKASTPLNSINKQTADADCELQRLVMNNNSIDDQTKDLIFINQSLIQRLFPSQKERMVAEMQTKTIQSALDFRLNLYKISTEFKIEAVREHLNALLLTIRGEYRQQVADFMLSKLEQLHISVDSKQRSVLNIIRGKLDYAATLPSMLQGRYIAAVEREADGFIVFTERQVRHFEAIIDEQIKKLG